MICPVDNLSKDIDIKQIFKVVIEEELAECKVFVDAFWYVLDNMSLEEKKLFLRFVTGLDAPPEPGTERLIVELPFSAFSKAEYIAMLDMLPQAHTCTNTLELPNYYEALKESGRVADDEEGNGSAFQKELRRVMKDKLLLAIHEAGGYELDAVDPIYPMSNGDVVTPIHLHTESTPITSIEVGAEKIEPTSSLGAFPASERNFVSVGVDNILQSRKRTPESQGNRSDGRPFSEERRSSEGWPPNEGFRSVESCSRKPSSESLQSLRSDPGPGNAEEIQKPAVPRVAEEPVPLPPPRRLEPVVKSESLRHSDLLPAARTESHKGYGFTLEPLQTPPKPPPIPFMGEFGNPIKAPSDGMADGILDQGLTSLLQSRYDTQQHPQGKVMTTEIDQLMEELELDMGK
jgi:hypothetical protein